MRGTQALATALALTLALHPALARAGSVVAVSPVRTQALPGAGAAGAAVRPLALSGSLTPGQLSLSLSPSLAGIGTLNPRVSVSQTAAGSMILPSAARTQALKAARPAALYKGIGLAPLRQRPVRALPALTPSADKNAAQKAARRERAGVSQRLRSIFKAVSLSKPSLSRMPSEGAHHAAEVQIGLLTGAKTRSVSALSPVKAREFSAPRARLAPARNAALGGPMSPKDGAKRDRHAAMKWDSEPAPPAKATGEAKKERRLFPKLGGRVFEDPERNKAFWRYFLGEMISTIGFQMYIVALPYLMKAFTRNTLEENGRLAETNREALNALVRQNRSLARIAHWVSQAVSYVAIPLFTNDGKTGPRKWLVRSALIRTVILLGIPAIFFFSGMFSAQTSLLILLGLIGTQSFFQGLYVTMISGSTARIMGDPSVQPHERTRANSLRTFASAIIAILAPAIAGKIAAINGLFGKFGSGSALIYGIYAASIGIGGLIFATIRMLAEPNKGASLKAQSSDDSPRIHGVFGAIKHIGKSMKEGIRLILKNRFLRTLSMMSLLMSLFSDPLVFNILPEFVEGVFAANPGVLDWLLQVPLLGWFMDGLVSTPMGFFALLVTFSSMGSAIGMLLISPMVKLLKRLGIKTEEGMTIPLYALAFLAVPAFWMMIHTQSLWGVLLLYGFRTLIVSFVGTVITGIYQKKLNEYPSRRLNQVLAADSFISIMAAIAATYIYGYVLKDVAIGTSLLIAGVAVTLLGLLRLVSPWLMFTKKERKGISPPPAPPVQDESGDPVSPAKEDVNRQPTPEANPELNAPLSFGL